LFEAFRRAAFLTLDRLADVERLPHAFCVFSLHEIDLAGHALAGDEFGFTRRLRAQLVIGLAVVDQNSLRPDEVVMDSSDLQVER
jgi:hypothetical protein